ncbi:MAG: hypothetical protein JOY93_06535 [Acidobacteriales bacterium]|nr:hypothetical protein [Terriglobales bacterium]
MSSMRMWRIVVIAFGFFLLSGSPAVHAQQLAKRLILKDGSYQFASKWEVKGDRVRYLSAERGEWEELPESLVDWDATDKFEKDRAAGAPAPEAVELDREIAAERAAEEARSPEVAPGLRLPDTGGVFLLETYQCKPQLVELSQSGGTVDQNRRKNILRAAVNPVAGSKQKIVVPGLHAKVQAHIAVPEIYVNFDANDADTATGPQETTKRKTPVQSSSSFRIVKMQPARDARVVGDIKIAVYGKVSQEQDGIAARPEKLTGGWIKLTPAQSLPTGEYAVVEMVDKDSINLDVWDFGVNPSAPANKSVITATSPLPKAPDQKIELKSRPHT